MKKFQYSPGVFLIIFSLNECAAHTSNTQSYQRKWMLVELQGFNKENLIKAGATLDLSPTKSPQNHFRAYMGCNQIFLTAKFMSKNNVKFSDIASTRMYCQETMPLETSFTQTLPMMTQYKMEGHYLLLSDGEKNHMKFIASDWD